MACDIKLILARFLLNFGVRFAVILNRTYHIYHHLMEKRFGNGSFGYPSVCVGKISSPFYSIIRFSYLLAEFDEGACRSAFVFF